MSNKSRIEQSEEIKRMYKPDKEELTKSIVQTIKEFKEGRMVLSSPLKKV
jgi:hypothetical protein